MQSCGTCSAQNPDQARSCFSCGAPLEHVRPGAARIATPAPGVSSRFLRSLGAPEHEEYRIGDTISDRFVILHVIGRGGMGTVFKVQDRHNQNEELALKVINPDLCKQAHIVERFRSEGRITRQLRHEHIITVYDVFEWQGRWHILMEYFAGKGLREWMQEQEVEEDGYVAIQEAADICGAMLRGLEVAHARTVHRDLKPENVLIRGTPGKPGFELKLVDFGIAKEHAADAATLTGVALGTTGYMAPEQQRDAGRIDARADLYAVGVIFYELLTRLLPIGSYDRICELRQDLAPWVDTFTWRALRYDADQRYRNAREMLKALERGCAGDVIEAEDGTEPRGTTTTGDEDPDRLPVGWLKLRAFDSKQGRLHAVAYLPDGSGFLTVGEGGTLCLWESRRLERDIKLTVSDQWLRRVAVSPDGAWVACGGGDRKVHILRADGLRHECSLEQHTRPIIGVAFSPDASLLATSDGTQRILLWDTEQWKLRAELKGAGVAGVCFSPDSLLLASATLAQELVVWDLMSASERVRLRGHHGAITDLAFCADARYLASASEDSTVRVWDIPGFGKKLKIQDHATSATAIAFSNDGAFILSAGDDGVSVVRRSTDFAEVAVLADHAGAVADAAFSPDGTHLVTVGRDGSIVVYGSQRA